MREAWLGLGQPLATAMCQFYTTIYLKSDPHTNGDSDSRSRSCRERATEIGIKSEREGRSKGEKG